MALIAPVLIVILGLTAEIGRSFFVANQVTNANREGALWAGHHFSNTPADNVCVPNDSWVNFERNIKCVIDGEETSTLIGCPPVGSKTVDIYDTSNPTVALDSGLAPFSTTFPPPNTPVYQHQITIDVKCVVPSMVGIPPLPGNYTVKSRVTTFIFWPRQ